MIAGGMGWGGRTLISGENVIPDSCTVSLSPACSLPSSCCEATLMDLMCVLAQSG